MITEIVRKYNDDTDCIFSGAIFYGTASETKFEQSYGFSNRSDKIENTLNTRFAIASGSKIFTAIAVCQLIEQGLVGFETALSDLGIRIDSLDPKITVHHLLTHTSGIPDYFDEEFTTDYESLWESVPMYKVTSPQCFIPLFQDRPMKFNPGTQFSYSNAGYILLGLIVEKLTGLQFIDYVQEHIFQVCGMADSGYFRLDRLPERTAVGYVGNDVNWKTNIYSIPVVGGPDGGAYTTAYDLVKFWNALMEYHLLSERLTNLMLSPQIQDLEHIYYGYGVWITMINSEIFKYYVMGGDPGIVMQSSYYPKSKEQVHILANADKGAGFIASKIDEAIYLNGVV